MGMAECRAEGTSHPNGGSRGPQQTSRPERLVTRRVAEISPRILLGNRQHPQKRKRPFPPTQIQQAKTTGPLKATLRFAVRLPLRQN